MGAVPLHLELQCGFFADRRVAGRMFSAEFVFPALMPFSMCRRVEGVKKEMQASGAGKLCLTAA